MLTATVNILRYFFNHMGFRKSGLLILAFALVFSTIRDDQLQASTSQLSMSSQESQIVALVDGTSAYNYDLELEKIALNKSISKYAFRSSGSVGANATAMWLRDQFEGFGLTTSLEPFEFTNWNLLAQPTLVIDEDGATDTTNDQILIDSFQSAHYSWPTPEGGVFADLVVLPLPGAGNFNEIGANPINTTVWNSINTLDKIVLVGREVRLNSAWEETYQHKLSAQPPLAVVYTWWYSWMSFAPPFMSSVGGRPTSNVGSYYWNLKIPCGLVNYYDGMLIRERETSANVSAEIVIPSVIASGPHYNVLGRLQGSANPDKFVIVSAHYDTVLTAGFVDNGAGTAGVLELARVLTHASSEGIYSSNYTIVFVAFAGEELGLVGAINYVKQHKAEMEDIVAVINLDCIGSDDLNVAQTDPSPDFDLDELILEAARDLNVAATLTAPGGSDQGVFTDPFDGESAFSYWWPGLSAGIDDAAPVVSSTMIISYPLFYSDTWRRGEPGWIHTLYDNSTSTQTLNWLEVASLEEHIKVAALSVVRVSPSSQQAVEASGFPWWVVGVAVAGLIIAVTVATAYFVKARKRSVKRVVQ